MDFSSVPQRDQTKAIGQSEQKAAERENGSIRTGSQSSPVSLEDMSNVFVQPAISPVSEGRAGRTALHQLGLLAHHQHFPNRIARQEKFNRSEIPKKVFNVPVVEHTLQARRLLFSRGTPRRHELHLLYL